MYCFDRSTVRSKFPNAYLRWFCFLFYISSGLACGSMQLPFPNLTFANVTYSSRKVTADQWTPIRINVQFDSSIDADQMAHRAGIEAAVKIAKAYFEGALTVRAIDKIEIPSRTAATKCSSGSFENTDYVIKVYFTDDGCLGSDTVAHAVPCHIDQKSKRPLSGVLNICHSNFVSEIKKWSTKELASVIIHEINHAMVFHPNLYVYFVNQDNGFQPYHVDQQKTKIDDKTVFPLEIPGVVKKVTRKWLTKNGEIDHDVYIFYTPQVVMAARTHFGCTTLEGAELENQGGDGSAFCHWEKRIFEQETMASTQTFHSFMSNITLALFYDSGWYKPNFGVAEEMQWGRNLGCGMVQKSCLGFIREQEAAQQPAYPFCTEKDREICSNDRLNAERCNWGHSTDAPPQEYDYFEPIQNTYPDFEVMDYCPAYVPIRRKRIIRECAVTRQAGSQSMDDEIRTMQTFSPSSRCFMIAGNVSISNSSGTLIYRPSHSSGFAACYEHKCENRTVMVKTSSSAYYPCFHHDQKINIRQNLQGRGEVHFLIACPKCEDLCSDCAPPVHHGPVGDPEKKENEPDLGQQVRAAPQTIYNSIINSCHMPDIQFSLTTLTILLVNAVQ